MFPPVLQPSGLVNGPPAAETSGVNALSVPSAVRAAGVDDPVSRRGGRTRAGGGRADRARHAGEGPAAPLALGTARSASTTRPSTFTAPLPSRYSAPQTTLSPLMARRPPCPCRTSRPPGRPEQCHAGEGEAALHPEQYPGSAEVHVVGVVRVVGMQVRGGGVEDHVPVLRECRRESREPLGPAAFASPERLTRRVVPALRSRTYASSDVSVSSGSRFVALVSKATIACVGGDDGTVRRAAVGARADQLQLARAEGPLR